MDQEPSFPSQFQKKTLWRAVTGLAILVIGTLLVGLIWLTSSVLGYLQPVFVPLAVSGIIAYLLDPVVQWLQGKGFSRIKGIATVFAAFLLFFGILAGFVGFKLSEQVGKLGGEESSTFTEEQLVEAKQNGLYGWIASDFLTKDGEAVQAHLDLEKTIKEPDPKLVAEYQITANELAEIVNSQWNTQPVPEPVLKKNASSEDKAKHEKDLIDYQQNKRILNIESSLSRHNFWLTKGGVQLSDLWESTKSWVFSSYGKILGFLGIILGFAMVPIYLYYFLKESDSIKKNWHDYVPLKASPFKKEVIETLAEINGYLISFFRGQVLVAFIDGILVGIALTLFGLDYGLLIGVVMALLGIIPYIGNILCLIPACIIATIQGSTEPWGLPQWGYVLCVVGIFVVVQQINSLVTAPKIVGDSVGLHPMTVIFSMLFWSLVLGGFLGALLAVPITAAVKVIFKRYVWDRQTLETSS
ncbi:AI-2E family transporter [Akkermansiaceae bacterium]|nr:AI-2E family transporter [Akkermansiaceae bacterium]